ncbi:ABC transporter substrate-binding protein [Nakamurella lactea]|uniref:ABC transporter substrate-binding protein n=1 Tax=Nakamurella lactea TaxID=459515 RepID=UPI00040CC0DC|nr:ABC transporter substrate-binding protein [Nakamurella lactea]
MIVASTRSAAPRRTFALRSGAVAIGAVALLALGACGSADKTADSASSAITAAASGAESMASAATSAAGSMASEATSAAGSMASGATSAAGAAMDQAAIDAAKKTLIDPSKLTVCTTLPFEPFESKKGGEVVGFDIDLVDFISAELGVQTSIIDTPFEGIKSGEANNSGKCDLSAAGMSITAERQKVMTFSDPYFSANFSLVVPTASTVTKIEDLKGKKVGGQASTTGLDWLNENKDKYGYEVVEYTGFDLQSQAILTGQVDAVFNDVPVLKKLVDDNASTVKIVQTVDTGDQYGFGLKLGNEALATVVNGVLSDIKADGRYNESYKKWFGTDAPKN